MITEVSYMIYFSLSCLAAAAQPPPFFFHILTPFFYARRRLLPLEDFSVGVRHGATVLRASLCAWRRFPPILLCAWSSSHVLFAAQDHSGIFCTRSVEAMVDILCSIFEHTAAVFFLPDPTIIQALLLY
jgi:hypothetical protein